MAAENFEEALRHLLIHEGGYSNHPSDPGGPTNYGITLADYRKYVKRDGKAEDVRAMAVTQAAAIYRKRYWDAVRGDALPRGVDYCVFDYAVNSGVGRAGKVLRRALKLTAQSSAITGEVVAAATAADATSLIATICDERLAFLQSLKTWDVFGAGWTRRVKEVRAASLTMVGAKPRPKNLVPAIVVTSATGGAVAAHQTAMPSIAIALIVAVGVAAIAVWLWRRRRAQDH